MKLSGYSNRIHAVASMKHQRLGVPRRFTNPGGQCGVEVLNVCWKPCRQFLREHACCREITSTHALLYGRRRPQDRRVLIHMALPGRKSQLGHPLILLSKVMGGVMHDDVQRFSKHVIGRSTQAVNKHHELFVLLVHLALANEQLIVPVKRNSGTESHLVGLHCTLHARTTSQSAQEGPANILS